MRSHVYNLIALFTCIAFAAADGSIESSCASRLANLDCRHFTGYKPCGRNPTCEGCTKSEPVGKRLAIVHLEAYGAVARSTVLLPAIKRSFPSSHVTWITKPGVADLLRGHPMVDRVLTTGPEDLTRLRAYDFDLAFILDKSTLAANLLDAARVTERRGFITDSRNGAIVPANPEARELWEIGLDDRRKFVTNQKTETQLLHEAMALGPYVRDEYALALSAAEMDRARDLRRTRAADHRLLLGIHVGCGPALPNKKLGDRSLRQLLVELREDERFDDVGLVFLNGATDTGDIDALARDFGGTAARNHSVREAMVDVAATDVLFGGDSFLMHLAIGLGRRVVAWFGPSVLPEIDFFERGEGVKTRAACAPCLSQSCAQPVMCYDQVDLREVREALARQVNALKPHPVLPRKNGA